MTSSTAAAGTVFTNFDRHVQPEPSPGRAFPSHSPPTGVENHACVFSLPFRSISSAKSLLTLHLHTLQIGLRPPLASRVEQAWYHKQSVRRNFDIDIPGA